MSAKWPILFSNGSGGGGSDPERLCDAFGEAVLEVLDDTRWVQLGAEVAWLQTATGRSTGCVCSSGAAALDICPSLIVSVAFCGRDNSCCVGTA
jgi:hypothetical protein